MYAGPQEAQLPLFLTLALFQNSSTRDQRNHGTERQDTSEIQYTHDYANTAPRRARFYTHFSENEKNAEIYVRLEKSKLT